MSFPDQFKSTGEVLQGRYAACYKSAECLAATTERRKAIGIEGFVQE